MTINQDLFDRELDHAAMVRFYEEKLNKDIDAVYRRHRSSLYDAIADGGRQRQVLARVEREVRVTHRRLYRDMSKEMRDFITQEADFNVDSLDKAIGDFYKVRSPKRTELRDLILHRPIRDNRVMAKHFSSIAEGEMTRIERVLRSGLRDGLSYDKIAGQIATGGTVKISRLQARALMRTAITQYASEASDRVYMENRDVAPTYQYVATLDARTTPICSGLDGRVFPVDRPSAPRPPQHWNCRSTTVPVVAGFTDVAGLPSVDESKISSRKRAALDGQVAASEDYGAWLLRQGRDRQLRHFGNNQSRLDLFLSGSLRLSQFVNPDGTWIPLSTLIRVNNRETERVNPGLASMRIVCRSPCKEFNTEEDFIIQAGDKLENFYDGPDATDLTYQLRDWIVYHSARGVFELADYRGVNITSKARNKRKIQTDPDNTRYDPIIMDEVHASFMPYSKRVLDEELERLRVHPHLTDADKDYIESRIYLWLKDRISGPQLATAMRVLVDAFGRKRELGDDFIINDFSATLTGLARANSHGRIRDIANKLETDARRQSSITAKIDETQLYAGRLLGAQEIDDIIRDAPEARKRISEFTLPEDLVDIETLGIEGVTKAQVDAAILSVIRTRNLQGERAAISIGKSLAKSAKLFPDSNGILEQHQKLGFKVLSHLQARGKVDINVLSTRNRWYDEKHNNGKGGWRFEQVTALDWQGDSIKQLMRDLELDDARFRLGNDDVVARPGENFYFTSDGVKTNQLIRTSNLNDAESIPDEILAADLNAKGSVERKADSFLFVMQKLFTRDYEGNEFRQAFLDRGDQNTFSVARHYLANDEVMRNAYRLHESNRAQAIGYYTPHNGEFWRTSFKTVEAKPMTREGWEVLQDRLAVLRNKSEYNTFEKRREWFSENRERIYNLGKIVEDMSIEGKSAGPLIKKLLSDPMYRDIHGLEPAEQLQFMRYAREVYRIGNASRGPRRTGARLFENEEGIFNYLTDLPGELDQAESGLAIQQSVFRNRTGMEKTNIISQGENLRLRLSVARAMQSDPRVKALPFKATDDELAAWGKNNVTTAGYGSKATQRAKRIRATVAEALGRDDQYLVLTTETINPIRRQIRRAIKDHPELEAELNQLDMDITEAVNKATPVTGDFDNILTYFDEDAQQFLKKLTDNNSKIVTTRHLTSLSDAYTDELARQLPGFENITNFWADVAASWFRTQKNYTDRIPWRSVDGVVSWYRFPKGTDHTVRRTLPDGSVIETKATYYDDSIADIRKAQQAYGVLGNFGNDSYITRYVGARATIYDGFYDNIADLPRMRDDVLTAIADAVNSNQPEENLKFLLSLGWPQEEYDAFVQRLAGLTGNATAQDVLDTIADTYVID